MTYTKDDLHDALSFIRKAEGLIPLEGIKECHLSHRIQYILAKMAKNWILSGVVDVDPDTYFLALALKNMETKGFFNCKEEPCVCGDIDCDFDCDGEYDS